MVSDTLAIAIFLWLALIRQVASALFDTLWLVIPTHAVFIAGIIVVASAGALWTILKKLRKNIVYASMISSSSE